MTGTSTGSNASGIFMSGSVAGSGGITMHGSGGNNGVQVEQSVTGSGAISITGTGGSDTFSNGVIVQGTVSVDGVAITGSTTKGNGAYLGNTLTSTATGDITVTGTTADSNSPGVIFKAGVQGGGKITVLGNGGSDGVYLSNTVQASGTGAITITGSASSAGQFGIFDRSAITGGGDIKISGTGGGGSFGTGGVYLAGTISASGAVTITGTSLATAGSNGNGVFLKGAVSGATGVTIIGTGGGTGSNDDGVVITGNATVSATHTGAVTIKGTGSATGVNNNFGVYISSFPGVSTFDGTLTVSGTGGGTGQNNKGVYLNAGGIESTGNGNVVITGTGAGSSANSNGVAVVGGSTILATVSGNVSLQGQAGANVAAIFFDMGHHSALGVNTGNVTLTGDVIDLGDANSVISAGGASHLLFQPLTPNRPIILGGSATAGSLVFSSTDLAAINQGQFSLITVGSATGTGAVRIASGGITFATNVTVQTPGNGSGGITLSNPLSVGSNALRLVTGGLVHVTAHSTLHGAVSLHATRGLATTVGETLFVTGTVTLNNSPLVLAPPATTPVVGTVFTLVNTSAGVSGLFANLPDGSILTVGGNRYILYYTGKTVTLLRARNGGRGAGP
jgi:hypothetical protein